MTAGPSHGWTRRAFLSQRRQAHTRDASVGILYHGKPARPNALRRSDGLRRGRDPVVDGRRQLGVP